jgi:hypothetical protein
MVLFCFLMEKKYCFICLYGWSKGMNDNYQNSLLDGICIPRDNNIFNRHCDSKNRNTFHNKVLLRFPTLLTSSYSFPTRYGPYNFLCLNSNCTLSVEGKYSGL